VGRDVGRDEGREQAEWRDLVARLEIPALIDPEHVPWPDRENLSPKTQPPTGTDRRPGTDDRPGTDTAGDPADPPAITQPAGGQAASVKEAKAGQPDPAVQDEDHRRRGSADRGRIIRPAGPSGVGGPDGEQSGTTGEAQDPGEPTDPLGQAGPRDYELDEAHDDDLDDWDDRYVPPLVPPAPKLDPVAKGAWIALFGGPGYLLLATLLGWQIAGWAALTAVAAFITGFVVLVIRLGDGPSKRDGPDQGAVV
jgi:hypothetical protein